jgi:hypothetical protein
MTPLRDKRIKTQIGIDLRRQFSDLIFTIYTFNCFTYYRINLEGNRNIQLITEFSPLNIHFEKNKQKSNKTLLDEN